jgi:ribosome biogenesis protein Nip4
MKKLKELNLNVGRSPAEYPGTSTKFPIGYNGQFIGNADTSNSRRMQVVANSNEEAGLEEEELLEQEDDMIKEILNARVKKENKYSLLETLENISEVESEEVEEESYEEVNLEEFSGSVAVAGATGPFGDEKRKNISSAEYLQKEQIERMRILEAYHQKTSNRLK